jgi:tight adherence protein B
MTVLLPLVILTLVSAGALVGLSALGRQRDRANLRRQLVAICAAAAEQEAPTRQILREQSVQMPRWLTRVPIVPHLAAHVELRLEQAAWQHGTAAFLRRSAMLAVAFGTVAAFLSADPLSTVLAAVFGALALFFRILWVRRKRMRMFEEQLPEAIDLLSRSIRAGHTLGTAMKLIADESEEPVSGEFRRLFEEQKYGLPIDDSLDGLTRRIELLDVRVFSAAVMVHREIGGNFAEILDKIASLIRDRFNLRRQLQVYTAQGRMSGMVLGFMPIGVGAILWLISPEHMSLLVTDPIGHVMIGAAVILQLIGYFWIWRTLQLEL